MPVHAWHMRLGMGNREGPQEGCSPELSSLCDMQCNACGEDACHCMHACNCAFPRTWAHGVTQRQVHDRCMQMPGTCMHAGWLTAWSMHVPSACWGFALPYVRRFDGVHHSVLGPSVTHAPSTFGQCCCTVCGPLTLTMCNAHSALTCCSICTSCPVAPCRGVGTNCQKGTQPRSWPIMDQAIRHPDPMGTDL